MKKALLTLAALSAAVVAHAEGMGVSATIGTPGIGVHVSKALRPNLNGRVGVNLFSVGTSSSTSDVNYDIDLKLRTVDALLDWFPMGGSFRVSGGVVYNANKLEANGKPTGAGTFTLNGRTYTTAQIGGINGNIDFRNFAPYLGIGWGNAAAGQRGWGFTSDLGVTFQGKPRTSLQSVNCTASAAICSQLATDLAAENAKLSDELKDFKVYPVVRIGAIYRF